MNPTHSLSSSQIFAEAVEINDPSLREAYVANACGPNATMRNEITKLLDAHVLAGGFLEDASASFPRRFGDYELLEEIARGGMGIVYRARQVSLDRTVAVKVILSGHFASSEEIARFRAEAAAAAQLRHPNIVSVHAAGEHGGQSFFSMDYIPGSTLADLVKSGPLEPKRAARYLLKIAEAIHYAHEQGILHRDLKPTNILIDQRDEPRVTDFGLAKWIQQESALTLPGQVLGSPNFIPPEQAGRPEKIGPASDVYALGGIFFYLLTGSPPFVAPTLIELLERVRTAEAVSPRLLNPSVPEEAALICLKCLAKEIGSRYPSARELADEIGRFLRDEPVQAAAGMWTDFNQTFWSKPGNASRYSERADEIIPARQHLFFVCRSFLEYVAPAGALHICDLGCGDGSLARHLLAWRPQIRVTLIDGSAEMIRAAARRLGEPPNVRYICAPFGELIAGPPLLDRFDAIVSSFAIHHLTPGERMALFFRMGEALAPGGWFVNIDVALPDEAALTDWQFQLWREWLTEADRHRPPAARLSHLPDRARADPENKFGTLESQLSALRAARFVNVDCLYRNSIFVLYAGQRPAQT